MMNKAIVLLVRSMLWLGYYLFYIKPLDCYLSFKTKIGLLKDCEHYGNIEFGKKVCVFVTYPISGICENLNLYLNSINKLGYSTILVSNLDISSDDLEMLKSCCSRIIIRKNVGRDFGAYKTGILRYKSEIKNADRLLIANDSVLQIRDLDKMFAEMDNSGLSCWGMTEAYDSRLYQRHHICSYLISITKQVLESEVFWNFWESYTPSESKVLTIKNGELGFSLAISPTYKVGSYINTSKIYQFLIKQDTNNLDSICNIELKAFSPNNLNNILKLLYSSNHNGIFIKPMLALEMPLLKKDIFSKCKYYIDEIADLMQNIGIQNSENIILALKKQIKASPTFADRILTFIGEK